MSAPAISVIVPAYNSAATLPRALNSVFAQSLRDYEVIVVDDGSEDALDAAVAPYLDRITFIRQRNAGAAAARNAGVRSALGTYLAFLDADDFWHTRKLELQFAALTARPAAVLCWTGCRRVANEDLPFTEDAHEAQPPVRYSDDFDALFLCPYLGTPGVMMRRERFIELNGFREDLHSAEDVDLWLRAAYGHLTASIPVPLFYVVSTPNSLTALHRDGTFRDNAQVIEDFCRTHPQYVSRSGGVVRTARAKVYEDWGSSALIKGELAQARRLLLCSLRDRMSVRASYLMLKTLARQVRGTQPAL